MLRHLIPLTLAAVLLAPLGATAQITPPAAPAAPPAPAPLNTNHLNGKITSVDAVAKTVTVTVHRKPTTLSVPDGTKIYKIGDTRKNPTGTFADLTVNARITSRTNGDADKPVATEIHLRAAKGTAAPAVPATPAPPVVP